MKLRETLNEEKFEVYMTGGSIGNKKKGKPRESDIFTDKKDASAKAKRMNKALSPGEKKYYKISYKVRPIKESLNELAKQIPVDTSPYGKSHGKEPDGNGNWFFSLEKGKKKRETGFNGKYSRSRSKAVIAARKEGYTNVVVLP